MMDYSQYEEIINRKATVFLVIIALLFIVCAVLIWMIIREFKEPKTKDARIADRIWLVLSSVIACLSVVFFMATVYARNYDIRNQAYLTYEGKIEIVNKKSGANVFIFNDKRKMLDAVRCDVEDGIYTGRVIYSQKTKIAFEIVLD
ncbi:MAG: hypothetical protein IKJ35_00595 [Clostridia bacterium]|nr:hypothetical protein [Clostridia bacterium]